MTIRSISNLPDWLVAGIADYQQKNGLQSWSQAAVILLTLGISGLGTDNPTRDVQLGGSEEAEEELWARYEASGVETFEEWLIQEFGGSWGGQRS